MTPFEYIVPLISVLVGLAIADLAVSFNRLLRARQRVRWDHLPLLTAFLAIVAVLDIWWALYSVQEATFYRTLAGFLPLAAQLILLFLLNAAALPDDVPISGLDLRAFYARNQRYFWTLFTVYLTTQILTKNATEFAAGSAPSSLLTDSIPQLCLLVVFGSLLIIRKRWYHTLIVCGYMVFYGMQTSTRVLGAVH